MHFISEGFSQAKHFLHEYRHVGGFLSPSKAYFSYWGLELHQCAKKQCLSLDYPKTKALH